MENLVSERIYLSPPDMGGRELEYIKQAFSANWISTVGPQIDTLEERLKKYIGTENAVALSSGTSAIHLALRTLGITTNDLVLCQSFTFAGSAFPIVYQGARPIFIDSEPDTWNMDPNILESTLKLMSKSTLPKAIIVVHLYGMPSKMDEINAIASKYAIPVIEDAAEALGATYKGNSVGTLGHMSILSFNGNKIITTSGGGAILSNNKKYIRRIKFLASQAKDKYIHYEHSEIGYNYRMGNINAAIGIAQMEVLDARIKRKNEIYTFYKSALADCEEIEFQPEPKDVKSNRWLTTILTSSLEKRELIRTELEKKNIESRPLWKPMHLQPVFNSAQYFGGNLAEKLFNKGLCLPSGTALKNKTLEIIANIILKNH